MSFRHRSGQYKQSNKPFTGPSKGSLKKKGKPGKRAFQPRQGLKQSSILNKSSKRNLLKQKRNKKREQSLLKRRIGSSHGPPKMIGLLSLSGPSLADQTKNTLLQSLGQEPNDRPVHTLVFPKYRKRLQLIRFDRTQRLGVLDGAKVVDLLLVIISCKIGIDSIGADLLSLLRAQGFPTKVILTLDGGVFKQSKKTVKRKFFEMLRKEFPDEPKWVQFTDPQSAQREAPKLLRVLLETNGKPLSFRECRNYLFVEKCQFRSYDSPLPPVEEEDHYQDEFEEQLKELGVSNENNIIPPPNNNKQHQPQQQTEEVLGDLEVRGFLRGGRPLNPNQLIHLVNYGTFQMSQVAILPDPFPLNPRKEKKNRKKKTENMDFDMMTQHDENDDTTTTTIKKTEYEDDEVEIYYPDPLKQESIQSHLVPDPFLNEPTTDFPSEEKIFSNSIVKAPPGTKEKTAKINPQNIITERPEDEKGIDYVDNDEDDMFRLPLENPNFQKQEEEEELPIPTGLPPQLLGRPNASQGMEELEEEELEENEMIDDEEQKRHYQKYLKKYTKQYRSGDYVATPDDGFAKDRFTKYRGMKDGFRNTFWDAYENLPFDYSKIYQFSNFEKTRKNAMKIQWSSFQRHQFRMNQEQQLQITNKKNKRRERENKNNMEIDVMMNNNNDLSFQPPPPPPPTTMNQPFVEEEEEDNNMFSEQQQQQQTQFVRDEVVNSEVYVSIVLKNVPERIKKVHDPQKQFLILFSLLKHENKVSVTHFLIQKHQLRELETMNYNTLKKGKDNLFKKKKKKKKKLKKKREKLSKSVIMQDEDEFDDDDQQQQEEEEDLSEEEEEEENDVLLSSKEEVIIQIGFRKYICKPIFSEHNLRALHKGDNKFRYHHIAFRKSDPGQKFIVGTVYSHVTYRPSPVLVFKKTKKSPPTQMISNKLVSYDLLDFPNPLVGKGSVINVDPLRMILKKIVLTGHIYRSMRRSAYVRFMFYNPVDIRWFMPVEIYTTNHIRGVIRKSVGLQGYMKCFFQTNVQQNQLVCMNLYKRVFPKWNTVQFSNIFKDL